MEHQKQQRVRHGATTKERIDDIRRAVLATSELAAKLIGEFAEHPIPVSPKHALSPASIGKGYLRAMGISPILKRQPNFPKEYLGYAQTAFFGGRTGVHIRKTVCPIVYLDFLSMYCSVNCLMNLWPLVIARRCIGMSTFTAIGRVHSNKDYRVSHFAACIAFGPRARCRPRC